MKIMLALALAVSFATSTNLLAQSEKGKAKTESSKPAAKIKNIEVEQFDELRQSKTNVVLDVRTREEYEAGHLPGAILIDFIEPDFQEKVAKLDKDKTYLVHCASGGRSARACKKMEGMGFKTLYNLKGGLNAWEKAGKPLEKAAK